MLGAFEVAESESQGFMALGESTNHTYDNIRAVIPTCL